LMQDYQDIFGVGNEAHVLAALKALASRSSAADQHQCPCGCGKVLAQCRFRDRIAEIRSIAPRKYFKELHRTMRGRAAGGKR
jgi:hypothetical protein